MDEVNWLLVDEWIMELMFKTQHHVEEPSVVLCVQLKKLKLYLTFFFFLVLGTYNR